MYTKTRSSKSGGSSRKRQKTASSNAPKEWPKYSKPDNNRILFKGLLSGHDERIWNSLAHIDPQLFRTAPMQVVLRAGLQSIGLGWIGTNNTQARIQASYMYKIAKEFYESNGWRPPRRCVQDGTQDMPQKVQVEDIQWTPIQGGEHERKYMNRNGELEFPIKPLNIVDIDDCTSVDETSKHIHSSIKQTGMVIIRGAVNKPTIKILLSGDRVDDWDNDAEAEQLVLSETRTKLTNTSASGLGGKEIYTRITGGAKKKEEAIGSFYCDINHSGFLDQLHDVIGHSLKTGQRFYRDQKKYIMLKYSNGGENWAHRDGNSDDNFQYQALLMMSSSEDYDGGEFYVARQCSDNGDGKIIRTCCPKLDAGDMVIFQAHANGGYDHGMKEVTRGERVAIGLFQPK